MKTQTKLALVIGLVCVSIVFLFGIAIFYFLNNYSYLDFYKRLETRGNIVTRYNLDTLNSANLRMLRNKHLVKLDHEKEYFFRLDDRVNEEYLLTHFSFPEKFIKGALTSRKYTYQEGDYFFLGLRTTVRDKQFLTIISAENYYVNHHLAFLRTTIGMSLLLMVLVIVSLTVFLSRTIFIPIRRIIENVKQITAGKMHMRLEGQRDNSEIGELISTFNTLLTTMETTFETQKNFISNASHELRTPLTTIIGEAEVTLMKERSTTDYRHALQNILNQAERLDHVSRSLLMLAQTEYRGKGIPFELLRLDEIIWTTNQVINRLNPGNRISIIMETLPEDPSMLKINGNRELLQLALANVLNNACKYSGNAEVTIRFREEANNILTIVRDRGIGIPAEELGQVFDPFYRASNAGMFQGYGIGLRLSRNIVRLHHGELTIDSRVGEGTTVTISLPLV